MSLAAGGGGGAGDKLNFRFLLKSLTTAVKPPQALPHCWLQRCGLAAVTVSINCIVFM